MKKFTYLLLVIMTMLVLVGCGHEHNYEETVVAPTCTEKGYTEYKCLTCDDVYTDK